MQHWWRKDGYSDYVVDIAAQLEEKFPARPVYAVGHSPSWVVYALAALRRAAGRAPAVGYIPHSGNTVDVDKEQRHADIAADEAVRFAPSEVRTVSPQSLRGYFNFLSRRGLDPATVLAGDRKPVLVDFVQSGGGYASFLDSYDQLCRRQTGAGVAERFTVAAYKMYFPEGERNIVLPPPANDETAAPRPIPLTIISGTPAKMLNAMAGYRGDPGTQMKHEGERGRFVPYYSLCDGYTALWARHTPPKGGLRLPPAEPQLRRGLKDELQAAVARRLNDPADHAARAARAAADNEARTPKPRIERWLPVYPMFHG